MYSDKDFQTFWFRYKAEGEPHGIIPVEIEGAPTDEETDDVEASPQPASKPKANKVHQGDKQDKKPLCRVGQIS